LALAAAGLKREKAYDIVQRNAMKVWAGEGSFHDLLAADPEAQAALPSEKLAACFDAAATLKHVDAIYARRFKAH
jgi:adenylosuccinate lyase